MEELVKNIPTLLVVIGAIVAGVVVIIGQFDSKMKDKKKTVGEEADGLEDRVRGLYKEESSELNRKMADMKATMEKMEKKIIEVETENRTLREIFQGRDKDSENFRIAGYRAMDKQDKLIENIERLATVMEKHLDQDEIKTTTTKEKVESIVTKGGGISNV